MDLRVLFDLIPNLIHRGGVSPFYHHQRLTIEILHSQTLFLCQRMLPVDRDTVLDRPELEEIAAVQPQLRVADPYQKVKFFSQGRDFSKDALMLSLIHI